MLGNVMLKRFKIKVRPMKPLYELKVPKIIGFIIIVIWLLFYMQNVIKLNQELLNVLFACYLCAMVFAIGYGALALMWFIVLLRKRAAVFLIMIAMFVPYVNFIIACIGVLDMLLDLKQKMSEVLIHGSLRKF